MSYKPDNLLLERIRAGQRAALEDLYIRYRDKFLKVFRSKYSCGKDEAEEVYQRTIVLVHDNIISKKITNLNNEHSLWTYIYAIGRNTHNDYLRKQNKITSFSDDCFDAVEEHKDHVSEENAHQAKLSMMEEALAGLGSPCSDILELFYYEDKSMKELAKELDYKNYDTAKNLKYKCLQRLKKAYKKISKITNK